VAPTMAITSTSVFNNRTEDDGAADNRPCSRIAKRTTDEVLIETDH